MDPVEKQGYLHLPLTRKQTNLRLFTNSFTNPHCDRRSPQSADQRRYEKADKEMHKNGYPVLPPRFPAMEKLTLRAIEITKEIIKEGFDIIEVHPASTRKALKMPTKDWQKIQQIFISMGLEGALKTRTLTPHETDAVTAVLTARLYLKGKTELIGDDKEGYIVVPTKSDWRTLQL